MNILFINDSTSNPNWGDRAASLMLQKMVLECGCAITGRITEYELGSGSFLRETDEAADTRHAGEHHRLLELVMPPAVWKLEARWRARLGSSRPGAVIPQYADQFDDLCDKIMNQPQRHGKLLTALKNADTVMIHGDGCMVGKGPLPRAELFLAYLSKKCFSKPVILVNHTAVFDDPDLLAMARRVYPLLDDVVYRERSSLKRWSGQWPGRYAADSAFLLEPATRDLWLPIVKRHGYFDVWPDTARFDPGRPYICIGGTSTYSNIVRPQTIMRQFTELVQHLQTTFAGSIVLTASDGRDQWIFRPIAERLSLPLVSLMIPVQQAVDILGNSAAYIGGRWHSSIFALRGGAPVIPLSAKTFKMHALVEMAGIPTPPFDPLAISEQKIGIGLALKESLEQGEVLRTRLRRWAQGQADLSRDNINHIKKLLASSA
jgi:polysaccharide pyruvyl transferase WcaK-like protein